MPAARGQRKTRSWLTRNQRESPYKKASHQCPIHRRSTKNLHRVKSRKTPNVKDLINGFLGNLAAINDKRRTSKMKPFKVPGARVRKPARPRKNTKKAKALERMSKLSFDLSDSPSKSVVESTEDNISMSTAMESATSRPSTAYSNASTTCYSEPPEPVDSKQSVKDLLKRKSLIQIINNYIKEGIEADELRAKRYMNKALHFGISSGYLKPVDNSGHLLEVSAELPGFKVNVKKNAVDERRRRKNMRRGILDCDDYNVKPAKKRAASKVADEKVHKETNTSIAKKRARSKTSVSRSALKVDVKKKKRNQPSKKKAKISKQPRKRKNSRSSRSRRSPTPWRNLKAAPTQEQNVASQVDHGENDHENGVENMENDEANDSLTNTADEEKLTTSLFRKDDSKNHNQDNNSVFSSVMNFPADTQQSVESAQQSDKQ